MSEGSNFIEGTFRVIPPEEKIDNNTPVINLTIPKLTPEPKLESPGILSAIKKATERVAEKVQNVATHTTPTQRAYEKAQTDYFQKRSQERVRLLNERRAQIIRDRNNPIAKSQARLAEQARLDAFEAEIRRTM